MNMYVAELWRYPVKSLAGAGGGGLRLATVPIEVAFHAILGIGLAILYRSGLALIRGSAMS